VVAALFSGSGNDRIVEQQVLSVDSEVCITRKWKVNLSDSNTKNYFTVWRRVNVGTFSDTQ